MGSVNDRCERKTGCMSSGKVNESGRGRREGEEEFE